MNILGVEFEAKKLNYVLLVCDGDEVNIAQCNRLELSETRSRDSLRAFQNAVTTMLNGTQPDIIAIKDKPESGQMRAGSAALKMEGILLASAPCDVEGRRIPADSIDTKYNAQGTDQEGRLITRRRSYSVLEQQLRIQSPCLRVRAVCFLQRSHDVLPCRPQGGAVTF